MRGKHIHVAEESQLLKQIYHEVEALALKRDMAFYMRFAAKFVVFFGLSFWAYSSMMRSDDSLLFIGSFVVYGLSLMIFAFNFSHDFSHNTIFRNKKINNLCYSIIYTLVGAHAEAWKARHVHSHHYAPNVQDYDSDLKITQLIRVVPGSQFKWYHRYQHIYAPFLYTSYSLYWIFIKDPVILYTRLDGFTENKGLRYHASFWVQKIIYLSLTLFIPLLFAHQVWWMVILAFLFMHALQSLFLLFTFFMTHHVESTTYPKTDSEGTILSSWMMNQVKSSNDMHPFSEAANFILGGFNNHIAHHLFPHVHHIHYPKMNAVLYRLLRENKYEPNQTSYWGGVCSHLRLLKRLGESK